MGNYLFCQECIVKALHISKQRLARQRAIKRRTAQSSIKSFKKSEVDQMNLKSSVVMPIGLSQSLNSWWKTLSTDDEVNVRFPHGRHGLSGKVSNSAKSKAKAEFLDFIDQNSQPNGRRLNSKNSTHYFLPKFTTVTVPKKNDPNYQSKLHSSITAEFNRAQTELERDTVSEFSIRSWLKDERAKHSLFPHKVDYCDQCAEFNRDIQAKQQIINRLRLSGSSTDELKQADAEKATIMSELAKHKEEARQSLLMYKTMTEKCQKNWKEIIELEQKSRSQDEDRKLEELKRTFTLILSADYQMSKLIPNWGLSPQPGSTYYLQKVSYDVFGIVDHREESNHVYLLSELIGPKNTDHNIIPISLLKIKWKSSTMGTASSDFS